MTSIFSVAHAQTSLPPGTQTIKILSWNIYMLPGFLGYEKQQRAEAIGKLLAESDYDVIVFQEAFDQSARKILNRHLQPVFSFQAGPANARALSIRTNSGLWIFSKHRIVTHSSIEFRTRKGVDAMSRKGGLLAELDVHGQRIQVIATHLQNSGEASLKQGQCAELFHKLLRKFQRHQVPQVVCGDFNIDVHRSPEEYNQMVETLHVQQTNHLEGMYSYDRLQNDLQIEKGTTQELIDFIFTRGNNAQVRSGGMQVKRFAADWHGRHKDLSDHYSIETSVTFQNNAEMIAAYP